jgi:hypothetical protein
MADVLPCLCGVGVVVLFAYLLFCSTPDRQIVDLLLLFGPDLGFLLCEDEDFSDAGPS